MQDDLDFAERQAARAKAAETAKASAAEAAVEAAERQEASESRGSAAQGVAQGHGDVGENARPKAAAGAGAGSGTGAAAEAQKPAAGGLHCMPLNAKEGFNPQSIIHGQSHAPLLENLLWRGSDSRSFSELHFDAPAAAPAEPRELRRVGVWVELQSGATVYYYNTSTQATQYECPEAFNAPPPSIEMTGGWQEMAAADGRTYYYHAAGNLTTWKKPATYKL